jgi:hypothetical protein
MLLALVAVRLPGHGATAAVTVGLATIVAVVALVRRRVAPRPLAEAVPVVAAVLLACSLPFLANDRIGELGAWVLDDLSFHMAEADSLQRLGSGAEATPAGYPTGPHSIVAAVSGGLGIGTSAAFTGLLLATPVLMALTALALLGGTRWYLRLPGAALVGTSYLVVSYFAEGAFKEPLFALFFLGFVVALGERRVLSSLLTPRGESPFSALRRWRGRPPRCSGWVLWSCSVAGAPTSGGGGPGACSGRWRACWSLVLGGGSSSSRVGPEPR